MSTAKANNFQVGQNGTATNNFTLYQPASPDGTVRLGVGNSGATTADVLTATSAGAVGVGTTSTLGNSLLNVAQGVVAQNSGATLPYFQTYNSNAGTNLKTWRIGGNSSGSLAIETVNDAYSSSTSRMAVDSSGNLQFNSGYGSVATAYGCRAWVNFNGTTATPSTIRGSGNVSSVTKNGTGDYTVNFTNAMPDVNYAAIPQMQTDTGGTNNRVIMVYPAASVLTTSAARIGAFVPGGAGYDPLQVFVAIFR